MGSEERKLSILSLAVLLNEVSKYCSIDQLHVASSQLAALFKVLLEHQMRIVCIKFQWRLLLSVHFFNTSSLKVALFFGNRKD